MLVKSHNYKFLEDFGLVCGKSVSLYDYGDVPLKQCSPISPVIRVNALWIGRNLKVKCAVADTYEKKRIGLQGHSQLDDKSGMYFPYVKYSNVVFHQGSVPFSLDLLFLRDNEVVDTEENTRVGSKDQWSCRECDGVLEVDGGFCKDNKVKIGDKIALFAVTQRDIDDLESEKKFDSFLSMAADCA